jgi:ribonuclease T2
MKYLLSHPICLMFIVCLGLSSFAEEVVTKAITFVPNAVVVNQCSDQSGKPFKRFSHFGLGTDGKFYKQTGDELIQIDINSSDVVKVEDDSQVDPIRTLDNFKARAGILAACGPVPECQQPDPGNPTVKNPVAGANSGSDSNQGGTKKPKPVPKDCNLLGAADSFVLAMSWQPAFCEGMKDGKSKNPKPECTNEEFLTSDQYQAKNFTLHGLWPNKKSCGVNYGFCSETKEKPSFGAYDDLELAEQTVALLGLVMPSVRAKSNLERHEWFKHGTCQHLGKNDYFKYASDLVEEFNQSFVGLLVRKTLEDQEPENKISLSDLKSAIDESFGPGSSNSFIIVCNKSGMLTEVQIPIACEVKTGSSECLLPNVPHISNIIDRAKKGAVRNCPSEGASIIIDEIGYSK